MEKQRREKMHFRVTAEEKEKIRKKAEKAGLDMTKYMRSAALKRRIYAAPSPYLEKAYKKLKMMLFWMERGEQRDLKTELEEILDLLYEAYLNPQGKTKRKQGDNTEEEEWQW